MFPQRRLVNRSQTGPVPLECERSYGRSASASGGTRTGQNSSSGCSTPVTFVKSKNTSSSPRPQSQSMDSGLVSLPSSSVQNVSEKPSSSAMRSSQSCNCLDQATHKTESSVVVPFRSNVPIKELFEMFTTVNDVIRQARNKAQRVLIFSEDAQATCQAFALAYSIQYYNLDFHRALCNFEKLEVKIEISNSLRDVLIKWAAFCEENRVREMAISRRAEWKETRPATVDCAVKRMAWQ